ncbi:MAG: hypothetical protein HYY50_00070 [Candidatus Kerfeldbacteria bacterium]|nr:hypothetical protein [Candidatus Kerfeldbacteria bacterium]
MYFPTDPGADHAFRGRLRQALGNRPDAERVAAEVVARWEPVPGSPVREEIGDDPEATRFEAEPNHVPATE